MNGPLTAVLTGSRTQPMLVMRFPRGARHLRTNAPLNDWLKALPGRRWDPERMAWVVTGIGPRPSRTLREAGFAVDVESATAASDLHDLASLDELVTPVAFCDPANPHRAHVHHRLGGWEACHELLGAGAAWNRDDQRFEVAPADLVRSGTLIPGVIIDDALRAAAMEAAKKVEEFQARRHDPVVLAAADAALATGREGDEAADALALLEDRSGGIPDWFSLDLYPFQRLGALAASAGRGIIADTPGLGKCVVGETNVLINDRYVAIGDLWEQHSDAPMRTEDGGQWLDVSDRDLTALSLDEDQKATRGHVTDIYREQVNTEVVRIGLRSGRRITCTQTHRFWTVDGWVASPPVGSMVAITNNDGDVLQQCLDDFAALQRRGIAAIESSMGEGVRWDEVVSVERVTYQGWVYDLCVAEHHNYVAEGIWTHNTRQALAAAAVLDSHRTLVVAPPVALTNWKREYLAAGFEATDHQVINGKRRIRDFPEAGLVVLTDSLMVSRPALIDAVAEWAPDVGIYDEAHRARTWGSARSGTIRSLADQTPLSTRLALTGTPLFNKRPDELTPLLYWTGQLVPVFESRTAFIDLFCKTDRWGGLVPNKRAQPKLRRMLDEHVWVRRHKKNVLPDLPEKSWLSRWVDVDLKVVRAAHVEVEEKVKEWLEGFADSHGGRLPDLSEAEAWCRHNVGAISPLRKAAGLAKVPAVRDYVSEWFDAAGDEDDGQADPLIVWCHHHEVMDELQREFSQMLGADAVRRIDGVTSERAKDEAVDSFQAGRVPVLIAQISAAGVAITLTRCSDALFAETDWTAALIEQAEDRISRIGATKPSTYTTLIAEGTVDPYVHQARYIKQDITDIVTAAKGSEPGRDNGMLVGVEVKAPWQILYDIVEPMVAGGHLKK